MKNGIEWQVSSLGPSNRLKELGVKQESLFWWTKRSPMGTDEEDDEYSSDLTIFDWKLLPNKIGVDKEDNISAFTVAELGEMLWNGFETAGWGLLSKAYGDVFGFPGTERIGELGIVNLMRKPNMGAKMLIYLIEQKLITV